MRKEERDSVMMRISEEQRAEFRRIIGEIRTERKATSGHRPAIRDLVASGTIEVPPSLHEVVEALIERDETGPNVGELATDFCLKRLGSEERVRLSSFQGLQPVALVFGSYT
ncbi:MAG: hypothetical protein ACRERE_15760 [Candidatus Entotheonellia bacterium]